MQAMKLERILFKDENIVRYKKQVTYKEYEYYNSIFINSVPMCVFKRIHQDIKGACLWKSK